MSNFKTNRKYMYKNDLDTTTCRSALHHGVHWF